MLYQKLDEAIPVTHPALKNSAGERYLLGKARTELGALRILHKSFSSVSRAMVVRLPHNRGPRVWEPA